MAEGNVATQSWLQRFAPDIASTLARFPFAVILAACATVAFLLGANFNQALDPEGWIRLFIGLATGAVCAVAGVFFIESRPAAKVMGILLAYVLPIVVVVLCQLRDTGLVVPFTLPPAAILWLSVSAFTRVGKGTEREEQQNRFWWLNEHAIATAAFAGFSFFVIAVGMIAIERSVSVLFNLDATTILYKWVLPATGLFLTPVYWLSTLPKLADYTQSTTARPDFITASAGGVGQFVLVPFLAIYAAILLVYTGQIVLTQQLPEGTIGWMVLGFVVAGAGTWLVLHPPFMREKPLVRFFRRWWWLATLIPLILFAIAVFVRIDAYGLTMERMFLVTGGLWAAALAVVFLVGRGDVRLIPAFAGALLALFSVGPWSYWELPNIDQGARLSRLLALKADPTATVSSPKWDEAQQAEARSALFFLDSTFHGRQKLSRVLLDHGFVYDPLTDTPYRFLEEIGYAITVPQGDAIISYASRAPGSPVNVAATPYYVGHQDAWPGTAAELGFSLTLKDGALEVFRDMKLLLTQPLGEWAAKQGSTGTLVEPWIDFAVEGVKFRLVLTNMNWQNDTAYPDGPREVLGLTGILFADSAQVVTARP